MNIAGIAAKFVANKGGEIAAKIMEGADNLFTSKEEKLTHQLKIEQEINRRDEAERLDVLETLRAEFADMDSARKANVDIQTNDNVPKIVKLRPTIIAFFVTLIWGFATVYIIGTMLHVIKRDINTNFEAVMALYSGLSLLFGNIVQFDFGSSSGSHQKQKQLDKLANK